MKKHSNLDLYNIKFGKGDKKNFSSEHVQLQQMIENCSKVNYSNKDKQQLSKSAKKFKKELDKKFKNKLLAKLTF